MMVAPKRTRSPSADLENEGLTANGSTIGSSPEGPMGTPNAGRELAATKSRRSHAKTRTGCKTCKRRKIKVRHQTPSLIVLFNMSAFHSNIPESFFLVSPRKKKSGASWGS